MKMTWSGVLSKMWFRGISVWLLILITLTAGGCKKPEPAELGIYLLRDDMPTDQFQAADLYDLELLDQPVILTADIISYTQATHAIELNQDAYQRIQDLFLLPVDVNGMPFVVSVGGEPVYGGCLLDTCFVINLRRGHHHGSSRERQQHNQVRAGLSYCGFCLWDRPSLTCSHNGSLGSSRYTSMNPWSIV
jgi:hypothetical protein